MILPPFTPGLDEALAYNDEIIERGGVPESLGIPSEIESEADLERIQAIMDGALVSELEARKRRHDGMDEATVGFERLHPRGRAGKFIEKFSTGMPDTVLGVTPYRGAGSAHGDDYYDTPRYKGFENDVFRFADEEGVEVRAVDKVRGVWQGGGEPSASVVLRGDDDKVRKVMDRLGSKYNQDGVISFKGRGKGNSYRYRSKGKIDPAKLEKALLDGDRFGEIAGATILPDGSLEIINIDGDLAVAKQASDLFALLGVKYRYNRGDAQLRFIEEDYPRPRSDRGVSGGGPELREGRVPGRGRNDRDLREQGSVPEGEGRPVEGGG